MKNCNYVWMYAIVYITVVIRKLFNELVVIVC